MKYIPFAAAALLFLGIAPLPIGYYTFLRISVCAAAIALVYKDHTHKRNILFYALIPMAILFNPIIPVYFQDKTTWSIIDFISGLLFLGYGITRFRK